MKGALKRIAIFAGLLALHLYGLASVVFQALNVGVTYDEPTFWDWGSRYLAERDPFQFVDHPPLAMWWGALWPKLLHHTDPVYFRLPHSALFFVLSLGASLLLWRHVGMLAAFIFATLVNFDPYIKAMAALHITDSDATWFFAVFALCLYSFALAPTKLRWLVFSAFFWGLALSTKISALFYAPFLALFASCDWRTERRSGWHKYALFCATVSLSCFAAYLGNWRFPAALKASYGFSMAHNRGGHITSLLGTYSTTGYWFYFLLLFLAKSPLATLVIAAVGTKLIAWNRVLKRSEVCVLLLPGLFLLLLLSRANAQVGYRYFMPGLVLLYICFAIAIGRAWTTAAKTFRLALLALVFVGAALNDYWILRTDTYLTSFNPLAPKPYRSFTEANVDWHQGVPKHLQESFSETRSTHELYDFLLDPNSQETQFRVGASELVYFWGSSLGMQLRAFEPAWSRAGHEVFRVTKADLYRLFAARSPSLPYTWKTDELKVASRRAADDDKLKKPLCPDGRLPAIKVRRILEPGIEPRIATAADGTVTLSMDFEIPEDRESIAIFRNKLGGQLWLNGVPLIERWNPTDSYVDSDFWIRLRPIGGRVKLQLTLPNAPASAPEWQGAVLWVNCEP